MSDEGWEARMAERARERKLGIGRRPDGTRHSHDFSEWRLPGDPEDIMPIILAARCLGLSYGDPGPRLPADACRECWGERYVWMSNTWGWRHVFDGRLGCRHACHEGEMLLAAP